MTICSVKNCRNYTTKHTKLTSDITFHGFPKNPEVTKKWMEVLNRPNWEPNKFSRVCSLHFPKSCFYYTKLGRRFLIKGSVPTLLLDDEPSIPEDPLPKKKRVYVSEASPMSVSKGNESPALQKLKKRARHFEDIARRRRNKCSYLSYETIQLKKQVTKMSAILKHLKKMCRCKNKQCNDKCKKN